MEGKRVFFVFSVFCFKQQLADSVPSSIIREQGNNEDGRLGRLIISEKMQRKTLRVYTFYFF